MGTNESKSIFSELEKAVLNYDSEAIEKYCKEALKKNIDAMDIVQNGLTKGLTKVGELFEDEQIYLPELLLAANAAKTGFKILEPEIQKKKGSGSTQGKIVIGTVEGDIHDIGKDIVVAMLSGSGFEVSDLGVDVSVNRFIEKAKEVDADIIASSALIGPTMVGQKKIENALKDAGLRTKFKTLIGGAPVTKDWQEEIGADGYAENAVAAVKIAKRLIEE